MMNQLYLDTVRLLLDVAPEVFQEKCFAMKGGTALNLFVRNMPRLSVDIDLIYADHQIPRADALEEIAKALNRVARRLKKPGRVIELGAMNEGDEVKLFVREGDIVVKIEVNHVFRGSVLPIEKQSLVKTARDLFVIDITVPTLAVDELYGSKLVAALDRQHPRDFFDVLGMYATVGLTPGIIECFVVYLAGHNRPVHEVLFSENRNMKTAFENEFEGMPVEPVDLDELIGARDRLRRDLVTSLAPNQRQFLIGLVKLSPPWEVLNCKHAKDLPALKWKIRNLEQLKRANAKKFVLQEEELAARFASVN